MSHFNTGYNQLLQLIPRHQFETLVKRHEARSSVASITNEYSNSII